MTASIFTANIQKGGALLPDARRLAEVWDLSDTSEANLRRVADENLLGKTTRRRLDDVLMRCLVPRFVAPGPHVMRAMKRLLSDQAAFIEAAYFETSRDETLLAAFAEGPCASWYESGRARVTIDDTTAWLHDQAMIGTLPEWSPIVRTKVGRGLLAALRDFHVLEGATIKRLASPRLSLRGFLYVAYRLHDEGASAASIATASVWRRWLLSRERVDDLFGQAARSGVISYHSVGSAVRIDWHVASLEEAIDVAA